MQVKNSGLFAPLTFSLQMKFKTKAWPFLPNAKRKQRMKRCVTWGHSRASERERAGERQSKARVTINGMCKACGIWKVQNYPSTFFSSLHQRPGENECYTRWESQVIPSNWSNGYRTLAVMRKELSESNDQNALTLPQTQWCVWVAVNVSRRLYFFFQRNILT